MVWDKPEKVGNGLGKLKKLRNGPETAQNWSGRSPKAGLGEAQKVQKNGLGEVQKRLRNGLGEAQKAQKWSGDAQQGSAPEGSGNAQNVGGGGGGQGAPAILLGGTRVHRQFLGGRGCTGNLSSPAIVLGGPAIVF